VYVVALVEQFGFGSIVAAQLIEACPDVIDGIASQMAAVGDAPN
jgi:alpha/beta superfamily hydrolase